MTNYEKANQLAVSASCETVYPIYREYTVTDSWPGRHHSSGAVVSEASMPVAGACIGFILKRYQDERWAAFTFTEHAATTYTVTVNGTAFSAQYADHADGIIDALIAEFGETIEDVYFEKVTFNGVDRLEVTGTFTSIACSVSGGSGTITGKCDALTATVTLAGKLKGAGYWTKLPVADLDVAVQNYSDIFAIGPYEQIDTVVTSIAKNGTIYSTGMTPCLLVAYCLGYSG